MPRNTLAIALLATFMLAPSFSLADKLPQVPPAKAGFDAEKLSKVDTAVEELIEKDRIAGCVIMVVRDGQIAYLKAFGQQDQESGIPMSTDMIFRIYSMTKSITTAAALTLYEEGKLDLDAPVGKYVEELRDVKVWTEDGLKSPKRQPTVRDLMTHTAGYLYSGGPPEVAKAYEEHEPLKAKDLDEFAKRLAKIPLAYEPGEQWIYSNSIDTVGLVCQRISGVPFDQFLQQRIFDPLEMTDTGFTVPEAKRNRFAANYTHDDGGKLVLKDAPSEAKYAQTEFFSGGGGLVGTARDYARFLQMIMNNGELQGQRILKPETVKLMTTNGLSESAFPISFGEQVRDNIGFGLGFAVCTAKSKFDPARPVGEFGWGGAASTHYWCSPADKLVVVTLEQRMPYTFETEWKVKPLIYEALEK